MSGKILKSWRGVDPPFLPGLSDIIPESELKARICRGHRRGHDSGSGQRSEHVAPIRGAFDFVFLAIIIQPVKQTYESSVLRIAEGHVRAQPSQGVGKTISAISLRREIPFLAYEIPPGALRDSLSHYAGATPGVPHQTVIFVGNSILARIDPVARQDGPAFRIFQRQDIEFRRPTILGVVIMERDNIDSTIAQESELARPDVFSGGTEDGSPSRERSEGIHRASDLNVIRTVRSPAAKPAVDEEVIEMSLFDHVRRFIIGLVAANQFDNLRVLLRLAGVAVEFNHANAAGK